MDNGIIIGFVCRTAANDLEKRVEALSVNGTRIYQLNCVANILSNTIVESFTKGADIVFMLSCPGGGCRYHEGDIKFERIAQGLEAMIMDLGLEPERLLLSRAEPYEEDPLGRVLDECRARAKELGSSPYKEGG